MLVLFMMFSRRGGKGYFCLRGWLAVPSASVFGCYLCHSTQIDGLAINNSVSKCGAGGRQREWVCRRLSESQPLKVQSVVKMLVYLYMIDR